MVRWENQQRQLTGDLVYHAPRNAAIAPILNNKDFAASHLDVAALVAVAARVAYEQDSQAVYELQQILAPAGVYGASTAQTDLLDGAPYAASVP